ncbi:MAG: histidine kinase [Ferruginibacter sp.]
MRWYIVTILFLFHSLAALSQNSDSLIKILQSLKDTSRIDCLNQLSYSFITSQRKDSAKIFALLAMNEATSKNYIHGIAVSLSNQAYIAMYFNNDYLQEEKLANESLNYFKKTNNKEGMDEAGVHLSEAWYGQSKFDKCLLADTRYYLAAKQNNDTLKMLISSIWIAGDYRQMGDYEQSFLTVQKRYKLAIDFKNRVETISSLHLLGRLYLLIGDYSHALNYYRKVREMDDEVSKLRRSSEDAELGFEMEFAEAFTKAGQFDSAWNHYQLFQPEKNDTAHLRIYWVSVGEYYFMQGNYKNALVNLLLGLPENTKRHDWNQVSRNLLDIGNTYMGLYNFAKALQFGHEGLNIALQVKARPFIRDGYNILYQAYDHLKIADSAFYYLKKFIIIKDSILSDQVKAGLVAFDYDQKIVLLNNEKLIDQQQMQIQHQQIKQKSLVSKMLVYGIIALLLFGGIVVRNILLKRINEAQLRKIAENKLKVEKLESEKKQVELIQQKTELKMEALRAQMNPHFIFNSLNSINSFILKNDKVQASEYLVKFARLVRMILQNSKSTKITLEDELECLQLYLKLEALRFNYKFTYAINIDPNVETSALKVPPLIVQPFVENAIWHGLMHKQEAGTLTINISQDNEFLFINIKDDGIGRKKAEILKHKNNSEYKSYGLKVTAERLNVLEPSLLESPVLINDLLNPDGSAAGTEVTLKLFLTL